LRNERITTRIIGITQTSVILAKRFALVCARLVGFGVVVNAATGIVGSLFIDISRPCGEFILFAVVLVTTYRDKDDDIVFIEFGKMSDFKISVWLVVSKLTVKLIPCFFSNKTR
jgi:hypothetical protein